MARLVTSGGEIRDHPTTDIGSPDGFAAGAAMCVTDTTTFRSGQASIKCPGTAANSSFRAFPFTAPAAGQTVFARVYFQLSALPNATKKIAALVTSADGALISARLTSAGILQLFNDAAGTQIGADSALTVETDRWHRLQLRLLIATGAADEAELLVKTDDYQAVDESITGTALNISDTHAARFRAGWIDAPGVTSDLFLDDVAVNDSTGTRQTSFPGEGRVICMPAETQLAVGNWDDCSGAATPINGVNKIPPVGLADHTTAGHTGANAHQARVAANTQQQFNVRCRTWQAAGLLYDLSVVASTTTTTTAAVGDVAGALRRAQGFVFGGEATIGSVKLHLQRVGSPTDDTVIEVLADSGGLPSGAALTSASIASSSISTTAAHYVITFPTSFPVTPGQRYWLVASRSGSVSNLNYVRWLKNSLGDVYPDGSPAVYDGTNWLQSGANHTVADHSFLIAITQPHDQISVAVGYLCHGQATTGAKGGIVEYAGQSPVATTSFNFGDNVGVAGTFPTNWRYARTPVIYKPSVTVVSNATTGPQINTTKNSGTGASNACLACAAGALAEIVPSPLGWARYQKTADSSFHWAKLATNAITFECGPDGTTIVEVASGDWAIYPEPQIAEGENYPVTLTSVTDNDLKTNYTPV